MFSKLGLFAAMTLLVPVTVAQGQSWDAVKLARGWARFDPIGAATFYDSASKQLVSWMKDGGVTAQVDVSKAEMTPECWVTDDDRAWVMSGNLMKQINRAGQVTRSVNLPAEVADADFIPPDGIVLSYRTLGSYVERRDIKNGSLVWSYGTKPKKEGLTSRTLHRILRNDESNVLLVSDGDLMVTMLDGKQGELLGQTVFSFNDGAPPPLVLGTKAREPIVWSWGSNVAFSAVAAATVPSLKQIGLLLARMDFSTSTLSFQPTGLTEDFTLAGVVENRAVFIAPNGGLVYIPVK